MRQVSNMTKISLILVILTFITIHGVSQSLTGKIYEIGGDRKDCKIFAECDCCTSELYFINDKQFALIDYCTFDYTLSTGTYEVVSNIMTLTFKQRSLTSGTEDEGGNPYLKVQNIEIKALTFKLGKCDDGALMLENNRFKNYKFGLRRDDQDEAKVIADFLQTEEWKLILK
jgi:hypothetical protein